MPIDLHYQLQQRPMSLFQCLAVAICVLISLIDGFDVLAIAFVAPAIAVAWQLTTTQLGLLFSSGLAGMVLGALFIAPLADRYGRRFLVLICLSILSCGMFCSGLAVNHEQLVLARLFTGLGMGAILPAINTVVAEFSSQRYRSLAISIMAAGYTVGGIIGGLVTMYVLHNWGWRYVFLFGGAFSTLLLPVVIYQLPESLDFLLTGHSARRQRQLQQLLRKLHLKPSSVQQRVVPPKMTPLPVASWRTHLTPSLTMATLLLCCANFMLMCSFYFVANWLPKILVSLGYSQQLSITASLVMNICGVIGGLGLGSLASRWKLQTITAGLLFTAFITMLLFGFSSPYLPQLIALIALLGLTLFGAMAGLYATAPLIFPPAIRVTGTGLVLGLARFGATLGPFVAGSLMSMGWSKALYFSALSLPLLIAAICIWRLRRWSGA